MKPSREKTEIVVPNDRIIVMAKLKDVDTNWVGAELAEYVSVSLLHVAIYHRVSL